MDGSIRIGSIFGIPVGIHYTWFAVFLLVTVNLVFFFGGEAAYPEWSLFERIVVAVITSLLFFASVLVHELAHSVVALQKGIPVKSITLFIFGGVAQIAREASRPGVEASIAIVGPLMSLALSAVFYAIYFVVGPEVEHVAAAAWWLGLINLMLAVFNMLPGFPMDGGRVFRALVWGLTNNYGTATKVASVTGRLFGFGLIVTGSIQLFATGDLGGLWLVLIGWFLENAARSSYKQYQLREALEGMTARDAMVPPCPIVQPYVTLDLLVTGYMLPTGSRCFSVQQDDGATGLVTFGSVREVPKEQWHERTVADVMVSAPQVLTANPANEAVDVLMAMLEKGVNQVPVVDDGRIVGLVTRESLLQIVRIRSDLVV